MSRVDAKIVLLGKSYVGKTCLVNKFIHERFDPTLPYQNTIGAAFGSKKVFVNNKSIVLGIWDTAGHERYESMTRMYYRGAVAAVLCYDVTDKSSFDRVRFWAGELKAMEESCRIYLCGTKKDLADDYPGKRAVDRSLAEPLAADFHCELYETSSKTGENIDKLFERVALDIITMREEEVRQHKELIQDTFKLTEDKRWRIGKCFQCSS